MSLWQKLKSAATGERDRAEEPPSGPRCERCGNESLIDVTSLGDVQQKLLCGKCGWHSAPTNQC